MNKKKIIGIVVILLIVILVIMLFIFKTNKKDVSVVKNETIKHDVVDKLYEEIDKNEKYVSKLYGYTSDENKNITMVVKEGYIDNNKVYDLEGKYLGEYDKDTLNSLLDNGTIKTYDYTNDNDKYTLNK